MTLENILNWYGQNRPEKIRTQAQWEAMVKQAEIEILTR